MADGTTARIDLEDGNWIEIRTKTNLGDNEHVELASVRNGGTTPTLAMLALLERIAVAWSFPGELTDQSLREELTITNLSDIMQQLAKAAPPNKSRPSYVGGRRAAKTRPSSGDSV